MLRVRMRSINKNNKDKGDSIKYGDIAILIRARRHLPDIENALHLAGIPYLTSEGIGFLSTPGNL